MSWWPFKKKPPSKPPTRTSTKTSTGPPPSFPRDWVPLRGTGGGDMHDEDADFFLQGGIVFVNSSNVATATYSHENEKMTIEFLDGSVYIYSDISVAEAIDFLTAPSKGGWVWDNLRVRGTVYGHKKPYQLLRKGNN